MTLPDPAAPSGLRWDALSRVLKVGPRTWFLCRNGRTVGWVQYERGRWTASVSRNTVAEVYTGTLADCARRLVEEARRG